MPLLRPSTAHRSALRWPAAGLLLLALLIAVARPALAQGTPFMAPVIPAVPGVPPGFDITGFIQEATLDANGTICRPTHPRLAGGTVTLNGQKVIIPCNTVLQMPAFTLTWADLFSGGPTDITPAGQTGLALADAIGPVSGATVMATRPGFLTAPGPDGTVRASAPLPSYEIHVVGNVVNGQYLAGLVFISQQSTNAGQGTISCIDYATGEVQVGGTPVDPTVAPYACPSPPPPGVTRVRLNDAVGRYGKSHAARCYGRADCVEEPGFDPRFTPDTDNPTVHASTGYPMCIPRVNPFIAGAVDPECPQSNRPLAPYCRSFPAELGLTPFPTPNMGYCMTYVMDAPRTSPPPGVTGSCPGPDPLCPTDPTRQVPFEIGDNVVFNGTLKTDSAGSYVSAHTMTANLGIYTQPNLPPAYTFVEEVLAGTDARPVAGINQEATGRVKFVGFTTDITNLVDLFALDQDPVSGVVTERLLGTHSPVSTPLLGRFRTPANNNGAFLPPTRNYRAVSRTMCANSSGPDSPCTLQQRSTETFANGLNAGQYLLPNFEFIFPENLLFGEAMVPNNFQDLPFLFCGSGPVDGPGSLSPVVGQLDPAPWAPPMDDPIFHGSLCPTARGVAAREFPPVAGAPDVLTIVAASWDNRAGKGKVNLVVTSSKSPAPAGMFMTASLVNAGLQPGVPGSVDNPINVGMVLAGNSPAAPAVCPTTEPCWQLLAPGFIVDPQGAGGNGIPTLVPPTQITVRSSYGGKATTTAITTRACVPTRRLTCL
ncbi:MULTISPECIES: hypothetical protein [Ramlibacter]|uniref:Uncharacterized protein n=1 Tax=Ramlibacter pinisoli TaxID=2682844 RepID=A0A6N8J0I8_9BURK|nr:MULTISPECIES: hypothetical protein [Ramlibacter]MBA2961838.1 hypothetical protein [Ramlibacter sp. CGMCC 1.13660]MVQ31780.1 hypothetical protein [Ramlibacter pinisoli]